MGSEANSSCLSASAVLSGLALAHGYNVATAAHHTPSTQTERPNA